MGPPYSPGQYRFEVHVTRGMYLGRGFSALQGDAFGAFVTRAGLFAQERTLGRVSWSFAPVEGMEAGPLPALLERNVRGICELAELFFRNESAIGENGAAIISFSNEGYRETYEGGARSGSGELFAGRLDRLMLAYFSAEQLSRAANMGFDVFR